MKNILLLLFVIICFGIVSGQSGPEWRQKVSTSLLNKTSEGKSAPFIILLSRQADVSDAIHLDTKNEKATYVFVKLNDFAKETQTGLIDFLKKENVPYKSLFIINGIRAEGNQVLIQSLAQRPDVSRIMSDQTIRLAEPVDMPELNNGSRGNITWGIDTIHADEVWDLGYRGQGVVVGGEDTGYEWSHPALKNQYRGYDPVLDTVDHNFNWHDAIHTISPLSGDSINPCGLDVREPCDDYGHGTHTMGTMIGLDGDEQIGVAPGAKWCACRNMERGNGSPFTYLECFQWFLAPTDLNNENPDPTLAPHVINNSWGCPRVEGCDSSNFELLNIAVHNLTVAGTVVVVSAGNDGSGCSSVATPAAIYESSFSVGATAENDTIAGFSSRGPVVVDGSNRLKPNISAPGVRVRSARPGGTYGSASGTSMAGPHVVGLVALIISANPDLAGKVDIIEDIIKQTAVPKTTDQMCGDIPGLQVPNNTYGYGRIDALAAVNAALALIPVNTNQERLKQLVNVYPNPADKQLILDFQNASGKLNFELFGLQGQLMQSHQWNSQGHVVYQVDISNDPSGIYFYRISMNGNTIVGKLIKN
jgi:subtilisin family serine protease